MFPPLATVNNAVMNMGVQISVLSSYSQFFGVYKKEVGMVQPYGNCVFVNTNVYKMRC